jgi:hypothetical protein
VPVFTLALLTERKLVDMYKTTFHAYGDHMHVGTRLHGRRENWMSPMEFFLPEENWGHSVVREDVNDTLWSC